MVKLNKKSKILALHKRLGKLFENNTAALILGIIGVMLFILGFIIPILHNATAAVILLWAYFAIIMLAFTYDKITGLVAIASYIIPIGLCSISIKGA